MLSVTHLSVRYGGVQALTDVSLKVDEGQIVTLLGINGAGKSTTLKAISGLVRSSSGEIFFRGESIGELPPYKMAQRGISYIPEGRGIFPK
jgi:branched-chain amino acid transport system ATP-binding protein